MTKKYKRSRGMLASQAAARLAERQPLAGERLERETQRRAKVAELHAAEAPIVADLAPVGIQIESVWDLVNTATPYPTALPVLLQHLERSAYPDRVREGLARALAVRASGPFWDRLEVLYRRAKGRGETEALAVALAAAATPDRVDQIASLLAAEDRGDSRILLLSALLRIGGDRGNDLLADVADDPVLGGEARRLLRAKK